MTIRCKNTELHVMRRMSPACRLIYRRAFFGVNPAARGRNAEYAMKTFNKLIGIHDTWRGITPLKPGERDH